MTQLKKSLKSSLVLTLLLLVSTVVFSQEQAKPAQQPTKPAQEKAKSSKVGVFKFETEVIDYGTIQQNANGERVFKFKNVGKAPIVISDAKGSCGCTVPTYSKNVIQPGKTGEIKVKYATDRIGVFNKTVTLTSNASEPSKTLHIKGEVLKPAEEPAKPAEVTPSK